MKDRDEELFFIASSFAHAWRSSSRGLLAYGASRKAATAVVSHSALLPPAAASRPIQSDGRIYHVGILLGRPIDYEDDNDDPYRGVGSTFGTVRFDEGVEARNKRTTQ